MFYCISSNLLRVLGKFRKKWRWRRSIDMWAILEVPQYLKLASISGPVSWLREHHIWDPETQGLCNIIQRLGQVQRESLCLSFWARKHQITASRACATCKRKCWSLSHVWLCATPWTVARQAPLWGLSPQEHWSGVPFPSPEALPKPGIKPRSPALQEDSLSSEPAGKPYRTWGVTSTLPGMLVSTPLVELSTCL